MRQSAKLLTSFVAGALVALPGLALAEGFMPIDTLSSADDPVPTASTPAPVLETTTAVEPETPEETPEVPVQDLDDALPEATDAQDQDTEAGHGEVVSALAGCLPSGRQLHGTGLTKGHLMRQAASAGEVTLDEGGPALTVSSVEEAEALCSIVQDLADQAEAPDHAVGRPDGAGPKDDRAGDETRRHGPPPHANSRGNR